MLTHVKCVSSNEKVQGDGQDLRGARGRARSQNWLDLPPCQKFGVSPHFVPPTRGSAPETSEQAGKQITELCVPPCNSLLHGKIKCFASQICYGSIGGQNFDGRSALGADLSRPADGSDGCYRCGNCPLQFTWKHWPGAGWGCRRDVLDEMKSTLNVQIWNVPSLLSRAL